MAEKTDMQLAVLFLIIACLQQIQSETCTFTRTTDTKGLGDGAYKGTTSVDECEDLCEADTNCVAIYRINPICYFAVNTQTEEKAGAVFSLKSCTADTTPGPTTSEPTTPELKTSELTTSEPTTPEPTTSEATFSVKPCTADTTPGPTSPETITSETTTLTNQQGICGMLRSEGSTGGSDVYFKLQFSGSSCLAMCQVVDQCQSVTYGRTSCQFYTEVTTTTTILGSSHFIKTKCGDGYKCCWKSELNTQGEGTPDFIFEKTLESCEALCRVFLRCSGIKWLNDECYVYVNSNDKTPEINSVYSKKTCTTGGDVGSLKFTSICAGRNGSDRLRANLLFYQTLLFLIVLIHDILC